MSEGLPRSVMVSSATSLVVLLSLLRVGTTTVSGFGMVSTGRSSAWVNPNGGRLAMIQKTDAARATRQSQSEETCMFRIHNGSLQRNGSVMSSRLCVTRSSTASSSGGGGTMKYEDGDNNGEEVFDAEFDTDFDDDDKGDEFYDELDNPSMDMMKWREQLQQESSDGEVSASEALQQAQASQMSIRQRRRPKKIPLIAIVGRPNVGKSALVNRFAGSQSGGAIVADEAGITRDRTYRDAEFLGERFQVVDTGGIVYDDGDALFAKEIREQAMIAIEEASGVVFVVDGQVGMTGLDEQIAEFLRKEVSNKMPVVVAVNKCESHTNGPLQAAEFWNLGLNTPFPVSAIHGVGTADLLEDLFEGVVAKKSAIEGFGTKVKEMKAAKAAVKTGGKVKDEDETDKLLRQYGVGTFNKKVLERYDAALAAFDHEDAPEEINVAIIGRPNVGKSSLLNSIFGSQRAIVSDVAGTTRDSIDAVMERPAPPGSDANATGTIYRFVDTAGIRRKGKVDFGPEFFMVNRALRAIRRSDVALLIVDATAGVAEQDRTLAQKISDDGRACVIVVNKWDAVVNKDSNTYDKSVKFFREELPQVRWAPILFISAETGQRVGKIYGAIDSAIEAHRKRISTSVLNEVLRDAILWQPPPARRNGSQAKIYYCNQVSTRPPTMIVFVNDPKLVSDNYKRYLDRKFRESIPGFEATPVRWIFRGRRVRDIARQRKMNGDPGSAGSGTSFPYPHAE